MIIDGGVFMYNTDLDGKKLPPAGAPNIMMSTGGTQLMKIFDDDGIYFYKVHVDWSDPSKTTVPAPQKIAVAPYHYLCDGQLSNCVSQPGTERRLDSQGDKLIQRLVIATSAIMNPFWRSIPWPRPRTAAACAGTSSASTKSATRCSTSRHLCARRLLSLDGQHRHGPQGRHRHRLLVRRRAQLSRASASRRAWQAIRKGQLTFHESVLAAGEASQTTGNRWEDYTTTAMDPADDCTFWYVGDYLKKGATTYSTRIGAFRIPSCK